MSSAKEYILDIFPESLSADVSVKKFVVKGKENYFVNHIRVPLLYVLASIEFAFLSYIYTNVYDADLHDFSTNGISRLISTNNYQYLILEILIFSLATLSYLRQENKDTMIVMKDIGIQLNSEGSWKHFGKSNERNCFIPQTEIMDLVIHEGFHGFGQVIFYMCILTKNKNTSSKSINSLVAESEEPHSNTSNENSNTTSTKIINNNDILNNINIEGEISASDKNWNWNGFGYGNTKARKNPNGEYTENPIKIVFPAFLPRKDILLQVWKQSRQVLFGSTRRYWRRVPGQGLRECT